MQKLPPVFTSVFTQNIVNSNSAPRRFLLIFMYIANLKIKVPGHFLLYRANALRYSLKATFTYFVYFGVRLLVGYVREVGPRRRTITWNSRCHNIFISHLVLEGSHSWLEFFTEHDEVPCSLPHNTPPKTITSGTVNRCLTAVEQCSKFFEHPKLQSVDQSIHHEYLYGLQAMVQQPRWNGQISIKFIGNIIWVHIRDQLKYDPYHQWIAILNSPAPG